LRLSGLLSAAVLIVAMIALATAKTACAHRETLIEALEAARQVNSRIAAAHATARSGETGIGVARGGGLPSFSAFADATLANDPRSAMLAPNTSQRTAGFGVTASVPILDGGRTSSAVGAATASAAADRETARLVDQQVLLATVAAYTEVRLARRLSDLNRRAITQFAATSKATHQRAAVKEATVADVAQAEAALAGVRARQEAIVARIAIGEAAFEATVQHRPGELAPPPSVERIVPASAAEAVGEAERAGPAVAVALHRQIAARYAADRARADLMPTLSLEARYQRRSGVPADIADPNGFSARAVVTVPFSFGSIAAIQAAAHAHAAARHQAADVKSEARRAASEAFARLASSRAALGALRAQAEASRKALAGVTAEAKVGQRTVFEVLTAQQAVLAAETALAEGERDSVVAGYSLLALVGRLEPAAIAAPGPAPPPPARSTATGAAWTSTVSKAGGKARPNS
jgi:outer membrane protein